VAAAITKHNRDKAATLRRPKEINCGLALLHDQEKVQNITLAASMSLDTYRTIGLGHFSTPQAGVIVNYLCLNRINTKLYLQAK
jgi:hypothetical protein